jgi:uncharacterized repeat protein (TIGR03803 family)
MWNMFSRIGFSRICVLIAALSLTMAPVARAGDAAPAAVATATESLLYSFGVGPTPDKCKMLDGADPKGSLTYVPATGLLFGRTSTTTAAGDGTVFQIMPNGTGYLVDHFFTGAKTDGNDPRHNAMTLVGNILYGTTLTGGQHDNGTIFNIGDDGSVFSMPPVFDFDKTENNSMGTQPHSCFVAAGNVLFGMTSEGGKHGSTTGDGTIFSFDTASDTYTRLYSFDGKHGSNPHGQLILDPNGTTFYGMTRSGGKSGVGVIFSFSSVCNSDTSKCKTKYKVLHNFSCPGNSTPTCIDTTNGATPDHGTLVQTGSISVKSPASVLYGLTTYGGKWGNGTIFSIHADGKHFTILQNFGKPGTNDGINPFGSLTLDGTTLYGTTQTGGNKGNGTVFQINTDGTGYARVYDFQNGTDAMNPIDNVIVLNNMLYGMAEAGGMCGFGAIFQIALP